MKFTLFVLLGLCAFAAGSSGYFQDIPQLDYIQYEPIHHDIQTDGLMDEMDAFLKNAVEKYNQVIKKFNEFVSNIQKEVDEMLENATNKIQASIDSVQNKIDEIKKKGTTAKLCVEKYENEMIELKQFAVRGIKECISLIVEAVKDFVKIVGSHTVNLLKNVNALKDLVLNCYNQDGTIATAKCAFKSIREAVSLIKNIINGAKDIVDSVIVQSNNIMDSIKLCKENYIMGSIQRIEEIRTEIDVCYNNGNNFKFY